MDVYIGFWYLGQIFIPNFKCQKQKSHKGSILWFLLKFRKSAVPTPPLCKKNFSNMPFLMSHEGVFHRGSKLAKSKKTVPHHLCGSVTIPLKVLIYYVCIILNAF